MKALLLSGGSGTRLRPITHIVKGDSCDAAPADELLAGHDRVVHFAAEPHVDRSILGADDFVRTNILGTQTLLDAALRHRRPRPFVHTSTR